jgi:hypothetical protein
MNSNGCWSASPHIKAEIEIAAEATLHNGLFQVAIRCGQDTHIDRHSPRAAHGAYFLFRKSTQHDRSIPFGNGAGGSDQVLEHFGTTFPVYVTFALTGMERLLREVRSALHRRKPEESAARRAVAEQMQSEMRETLTVMMLSCELAMAVPDIPSPAAEKIRTIDNLARQLRLRLEVN